MACISMDQLDLDSESMTYQLQVQLTAVYILYTYSWSVGQMLTGQMSERDRRHMETLKYELSIMNGDVICFQVVSCRTVLQMYKACLMPEVQAKHVGGDEQSKPTCLSLRKHI